MTRTGESIRSLMEQLASDHPSERCEAIEAFAQRRHPRAVRILHKALLFDPSDLVRCTAAEQLGHLGNRSSLPYLIAALADTSWLVRGWAAAAIGDIATVEYRTLNIRHIMQDAIRFETHPFAALNMSYALYRLGEREQLPRLIDYLSHRSYRIRCAAAHTLAEIVSGDNRQAIREALEKALVKERTQAASSAIRSALMACEGANMSER
jgi:HEAT repeat protein